MSDNNEIPPVPQLPKNIRPAWESYDNRIPDESEIARLAKPKVDPPDSKWLDKALTVVGRFLRTEATQLEAGKWVHFTWPAMRDMGGSRRKWNKHYKAVIPYLTGRGYIVGYVDAFGLVALRIQLKSKSLENQNHENQ